MSEPDELLTIYHCPGCEVNAMAAKTKVMLHEPRDKGDQLCCGVCGTRLCAEDFHDYVNKEVSHYDE